MFPVNVYLAREELAARRASGEAVDVRALHDVLPALQPLHHVDGGARDRVRAGQARRCARAALRLADGLRAAHDARRYALRLIIMEVVGSSIHEDAPHSFAIAYVSCNS